MRRILVVGAVFLAAICSPVVVLALYQSIRSPAYGFEAAESILLDNRLLELKQTMDDNESVTMAELIGPFDQISLFNEMTKSDSIEARFNIPDVDGARKGIGLGSDQAFVAVSGDDVIAYGPANLVAGGSKVFPSTATLRLCGGVFRLEVFDTPGTCE